MAVSANLEEAVKADGKSVMKDIEKAVTLSLIDDNWKEHLRAMDELKDSVQSASFEQKDPLVVYKLEAFTLFEKLIYKINYDVSSYLLKGNIEITENRQLKEAKTQKTDLSKVQTSREELAAKAAAAGTGRGRSKPETIKRTNRKIGRNEPCPCGSGKKYKHCHGLK